MTQKVEQTEGIYKHELVQLDYLIVLGKLGQHMKIKGGFSLKKKKEKKEDIL